MPEHPSRSSEPTAIDLSGPFLRTTGLECGITQHTLDGPAYVSLFRSVRLRAAIQMTPLVRARAALLVSPEGAVISHHTAAQLWGGVVPDQPHTHITVLTAGSRPQRDGLRAHACRRRPRTVRIHGVEATTPEQTFVDLAGVVELVDLVVLGDSLVGARRTTPEALLCAARSARGRGSRRARAAAALVRADVESPMESRARLLIVLAGLPEPQVNVTVRRDGRTYRLDLSYPRHRLAIEYDGRHHAESEAQWAGDITRREDFDRWGWRIVVLRSVDIYRTPDEALRRIVAAMRDCGVAVPSRVPRPAASLHFPGRRVA